MESYYIQNLKGEVLEKDVTVIVPSSMLTSSGPSIRRRSSEDISTIDLNAVSNISENQNELYDDDDDDDDDDSSVENSYDSTLNGWFVCPCFLSKYTRITSMYKKVNEVKKGKYQHTDNSKDNHVSRMEDSLTSIDSFEDPVKPKTGIDSNSSVAVTVVEEESWSTESFSSEEDVCDVDENDYRRQVRFGSVEVRQYAIVIGDHYSCKQYPMTLDWSYSDPETISVNDHENEQNNRKRERRSTYANFSHWFTPSSTTVNGGNTRRESYIEQFRLGDSKTRFERILEVTGLQRDELCDLETIRLAKFFENRRRANIGLPLL